MGGGIITFDLEHLQVFTNFFTVTDNNGAEQKIKMALLKSADGQDMIYLFKYVGKVEDNAAFDNVIATIRAGITAQTNQAMMRCKIFKDMNEPRQPTILYLVVKCQGSGGKV